MPWFNLPRKSDFNSGGIVYDACGNVHYYSPADAIISGMPTVLENLILPSILFKAASLYLYFGPGITSVEEMCLLNFNDSVVSGISRYEADIESTHFKNLTKQIELSDDYKETILSVQEWILGGQTYCE